MYYGVMVIAPTVLFALLNPLVFLLPVESGERVGLAMTILLSYALFLMTERRKNCFGIAHAINVKEHCCSSKGNFEISVGHLASNTSPGLYTTSPVVMINALKLVSPPP
jgi:hypothetical protein